MTNRWVVWDLSSIFLTAPLQHFDSHTLRDWDEKVWHLLVYFCYSPQCLSSLQQEGLQLSCRDSCPWKLCHLMVVFSVDCSFTESYPPANLNPNSVVCECAMRKVRPKRLEIGERLYSTLQLRNWTVEWWNHLSISAQWALSRNVNTPTSFQLWVTSFLHHFLLPFSDSFFFFFSSPCGVATMPAWSLKKAYTHFFLPNILGTMTS